jgi:hypothetical protein
MKPGSIPNQGSFASYLIGISEGMPGNINPPVNSIGTYPIDPPSNGSGDRQIVTEKTSPPVNPVGIYPIAPPLNGSGDRQIVTEKTFSA